MQATSYPHLLGAGRIGSLELRNRIAVTAMGVSLSEDDGSVGERLIAYHEAQARGGAGLIISGVTGVAWPVGAASSMSSMRVSLKWTKSHSPSRPFPSIVTLVVIIFLFDGGSISLHAS